MLTKLLAPFKGDKVKVDKKVKEKTPKKKEEVSSHFSVYLVTCTQDHPQAHAPAPAAAAEPAKEEAPKEEAAPAEAAPAPAAEETPAEAVKETYVIFM